MDRRYRHESRRPIGDLKPQDHSTRRLVLIIAGTSAGLAVLFLFAYVLGRLDNFDDQETPQIPSPEHIPQHSQHNP